MTVAPQATQSPEAKPNDRELNFRKQEELFKRMMAEKDARLAEIERQLQQKNAHEDEPDDEPYVDHKKLNKKLASFGDQNKKETISEIQKAVQQTRQEMKKEIWLENNPDFYEVLEHAEKLAQKSPALAKTILAMPDTFERQQLVFQNIKELGLHLAPQKQPTIQDKIDANRRSPFYQPSGVGTAPFAGSQSDFSLEGQKAAHAKMQELKSRLRV
jgi:hypothetical protein